MECFSSFCFPGVGARVQIVYCRAEKHHCHPPFLEKANRLRSIPSSLQLATKSQYFALDSGKSGPIVRTMHSNFCRTNQWLGRPCLWIVQSYARAMHGA